MVDLVTESPLPTPNEARPDLDRRAEIHDMVIEFYRAILFDVTLAPVFTEVAEVDWGEHIPKLIDYWCRVLLGDPGYEGQFLAAHASVHAEEPFHLGLFDAWYILFCETVREGWEGPRASQAIRHAAHMGAVLARRILGVTWTPPDGGRGTPLLPLTG